MSDERHAEAYRRFAGKLEQLPKKGLGLLIGGASWWSLGGPNRETFVLYADRQGNERVGRRIFPAIDGTDRVYWEYTLMLGEHPLFRHETADSLEAAAEAVLQFQPEMMTLIEGDRRIVWVSVQPTVWAADVDGDLLRVVGTTEGDHAWSRDSEAVEPLSALSDCRRLIGRASTVSQAMHDCFSSLARFRAACAAIGADLARIQPGVDKPHLEKAS